MKRIFFVGGGSLGPVTPLLAVLDALRKRHPSWSYVWVGTPKGPEKILVEQANVPFFSLPVVKMPRYPSFEWIALPWKWMKARRAAKELLKECHPDAVVGVGGFTQVQLMRLGHEQEIPCVIHQLDRIPGLANRSVAKICDSVTTSFAYEQPPFPGVESEPIASPTRFGLNDLPTREIAARHFGLDPSRPIVLIFGGGTGSMAINEMVASSLDHWLDFTQVIHGTGLGKEHQAPKQRKGYVTRGLFSRLVNHQEEMLLAYAAADIVIARAGFGTMSEAGAALQKPLILIPLPDSQQEANAEALDQAGAAIVIEQESPTFADDLIAATRDLLQNAEERLAMCRRLHQLLPVDDGTQLAKKIEEVLEEGEE